MSARLPTAASCRRTSGARPTAATSSITSAAEGLSHDVEDTEVLVGRAHGRYIAVCGATVIPAALTAPDGRLCRSCAALRCVEIAESTAERPARAARRAQSRWLATCSTIMRGTLRHRAVAWS